MELDQKTLAAVQNSKWWCVTDKEVEEIVRAYLAALPTAGPAGTSGPVATSSAERFIISHGIVFSVGGGGVVASGGGTAMSSDHPPPSDPVRDAAPELLAAARNVVHWTAPIELCAPELGPAHTALHRLRAAIAKAEGRK